MAQVRSRRVGRRPYNGFELNLYGFLPRHLIYKDQQAATPGVWDFWDPANSRVEQIGDPGETAYTTILQDKPIEGTVAVFSGPQALADDGRGLLLDGGGVQRGTVNYETARIQVNFEDPAVYDVYATYATGSRIPTPTLWDDPDFSENIWDRVTNQPVLQRTFWAIELDATDIVNRIDSYRDLSYIDTISEENAPLAFEGYGFENQIVDIDIELSRAWLRSLRNQWQLKNAYRMWIRLLQNLGFDAEVFELYKKHPLDNYGENPGEIYSRVYTEITLEEQLLYERALKAAGYDPSAVPPPVTGATVNHTIGIGQGSNLMPVQVPVIADPPDWTTITFELSSLSGGVDPEVLTLDPNTGDVTGSLGAEGFIDLFTGSGQIDFGRVLSSEYKLTCEYTVIGTPYQAARVDVSLDLDESVPYKSGDRAPGAVRRALEYVRPIHVLIRLMILNLVEDEEAAISEGSCCGPNQADIVEYEYPTDESTEVPVQPAGVTLYGGILNNPPVVRGTVQIIDVGGGQTIVDNGLGGFFGDGVGAIDYSQGLWWVQFNSPTVSQPSVSYQYYQLDLGVSGTEQIRYMADAMDMGEARFDRDFSETFLTYDDEDIDSDYKVLAGDLVSGKQYAGVLHTDLIANQVVIRDYATGQLITDDGAGNLVGDVDGGGTNTVNYTTGAYDVTFASAPADPLAVFQFDSTAAHLPDQEDAIVGFEDNAKIEGDVIRLQIGSTETGESVGPSGTDVYSGTLAFPPVPGSVNFYEDPGAAQSISDANPASPFVGDGTGTINYVTRQLGIVFDSPTVGSPVVRYKYIDAQGFEIDNEITLGPPGQLSYSTTLTGGQIVPGSVIVEDEASSQTAQDTGEVPLSGNGVGTLNYLTKDYSLDFVLVTANPVVVDYLSGAVEVY